MSLPTGVEIGAVISVSRRGLVIPAPPGGLLFQHLPGFSLITVPTQTDPESSPSQVWACPCPAHAVVSPDTWCVVAAEPVLSITSGPAVICFDVFQRITILFQIYHPSCYEHSQNVNGPSFLIFALRLLNL